MRDVVTGRRLTGLGPGQGARATPLPSVPPVYRQSWDFESAGLKAPPTRRLGVALDQMECAQCLVLSSAESTFFSGRPITLHADDVTPIRDDSNQADVPVSLIRNRKSTINSWMALKFNVTGARQRSIASRNSPTKAVVEIQDRVGCIGDIKQNLTAPITQF